MVAEPTGAVPEWTQLGKKRGVDPLGMQNSSVRIYQKLLPGISNVTLRIRYYGLYVWLAHRYAMDVRDTDTKNWQRRIRRAEALYALIAGAKGDETGVAGAEWAAKRLTEAGARRIDFRDDSEPGGADTHYLAAKWGVFGQAYQSQLFTIGVLANADEHEIPTPAHGLGEELAHAFSDSVGDQGEVFLSAVEKGVTSRAELEALSVLGPSAIGRGKERALYQRMLLNQVGTPGGSHDERRKTLKLVLHWADASASAPTSHKLRWSMYSGYLDEKAVWTPGEELEPHRLRWGIYQANDMLHVALEILLKYFLDHLDAFPAGVQLDRLIEEVASGALSCLDGAPATWNEFVDGLEPPANAMDEADTASEWSLLKHTFVSGRILARVTDVQCAAAVKVLGLVQKRMAPKAAGISAELSGLNPLGFRSLLTELEFLKQNGATNFSEMLRRLFLERVVRRHLWVAMHKLRYQSDYTFLFDCDDGLVQSRGKDGPVWTGPRLVNAITFLKDIGLLSTSGITARGKRALEAT